MPKVITIKQQDLIKEETARFLPSWVEVSSLPKYMARWFAVARDEAFKSNFHTFKVGCVIVYKNHIIGRGHNQLKTDPYQKRYNTQYRKWTNDRSFSYTCGHTIHAEIDALTSIPYPVALQVDWKKAKVYVFRVSLSQQDGYTGLALPCEACAAALSDSGIRDVYYTTGRIDKPFGHCDL